MKKGVIIVLLSFCSLMTFSQTNVVEFLKGGQKDANALFRAYLEPYAFALGDGLNNGWYNTAATHHLWGFDFTIGVSAVQIPDGSKSFDINKMGLSRMQVKSGSRITPTVAGAKTEGPLITVYEDDNKTREIGSFNSPQGTGLDMVPVPMVQLGFGLIPHTDLIGRFVPELEYDNNGDQMKVGLWGIGIKHNFMEWIPVLKTLPFDASLFASLSEVNGESELDYGSGQYDPVMYTPKGDQMFKMTTKTTKFGLVLSKKVSILTVFGGIGQSTSKTDVGLLGTYPIESSIAGIKYVTSVKDPIALSFETSNLSIDAGLRIKLAVFSLFGSINKSEYTSYNAGLSLGFR